MPSFAPVAFPFPAAFGWLRRHSPLAPSSLSWISPGVLGHAARTVVAAILALYVAYAVQLENPQLAMLTVLLVSNPMSGAVISKSVWRLIATVIGAVVGLALMAGFGQAPGAFMLLFALWTGLCVVMATRLRRFRAYAAALAGYTLALTTMGAVGDPLHTFDLAHARIGAITIGVLSKMLVSGVLWPVTAAERLDSRLRRVGGEVALFLLDALADPAWAARSTTADRRTRDLLAEIQTLDDIAAYASVESAAFQAQGRAARAAAAALYGLLSGAPPLARALAPLPEGAGVLRDSAAALVAGDLSAFRKVAADALRQTRALSHRQGDPARVAAANRVLEAVNGLVVVATAQDAPRAATLDIPAPDAPDGPPGAALVIAVRTVLGTGLAAAFWMLTYFPAGPLMMTVSTLVSALLASRTNPLDASVQTFRAAIWAGLIGMVYTFLVLPRLTEFAELALVLAPLILGCVVLASRPGQGDFATFLPVLMIIIMPLANAESYDLQAFLNNALACVLGTGWVVLVYKLILPVDPRREAARLLALVGADVRAVADAAQAPSMPGWEFRQYNRLVRLAAWQAEAGTGALVGGRGDALAAARRQLEVGRGLIALRHLLAAPALPEDQRRQGELIVGAVARLVDAPGRLVAFLRRSARRVAAAAAVGRREGERRALMALAAACHQLADAVADGVGPGSSPPSDPPSPPVGGGRAGPDVTAVDVSGSTPANQDGVSGTTKVPA